MRLAVNPLIFNNMCNNVYPDSANVGFPQLIRGYKLIFTVKASRCIIDNKRMTNEFDIFAQPQSFNC